MLHIQSYLRGGGNLARLVDSLALDCKYADGKVLLNYSMIDSPKLDPIVKECRGLILYEDNWDVASMAFSRFFNLGEGGAEDLGEDLSKCLVLPKLDGSMVSVWYDRTCNRWQCSTRGMIYADGGIGQLSATKKFSDLFWETIAQYGVPIEASDTGKINLSNPANWSLCDFVPSALCTFVFELTSLENRIVTPYDKPNTTLLTIRRNDTLNELSLQQVQRFAKWAGLPCIQPVVASDWETLRSMQGLKPTDEGYVVVRESFEGSHRRLKVKNPAYLAIAKLFGKGTTEKALLELIKIGDWPEFLTYYPEYEGHINKLKAAFQHLCNIIRKDYIDLEPLKERKPFAIEASKKLFPSILFMMRDGKIGSLEKDLFLLPVDKLLLMIKRAENAKV